jgi:hypothetical protein
MLPVMRSSIGSLCAAALFVLMSLLAPERGLAAEPDPRFTAFFEAADPAARQSAIAAILAEAPDPIGAGPGANAQTTNNPASSASLRHCVITSGTKRSAEVQGTNFTVPSRSVPNKERARGPSTFLRHMRHRDRSKPAGRRRAHIRSMITIAWIFATAPVRRSRRPLRETCHNSNYRTVRAHALRDR